MWIEFAKDYATNIWQYSSVGCATVSADGTTITAANQYFASTLEYTTLEIEGKHIDLITAEEYRGIGIAEIRRVINGDLPYFEQVKFYVSKTGKRIKAKTQSFAIRNADGQIDHFFSVVHFVFNGTADNSRLAVAESQLKDLQGLVNAMVGKSEKVTVYDQSASADRGSTVTRSDVTNQSKVMFAVLGTVALIAVVLVTLALSGNLKIHHSGSETGNVEVEVESK